MTENPRKKEIRIKMNPNTDFQTGRITGKLNSVIIDSGEEVSVTITSSLGYLIFHKSQTRGVNYYAPRAILQGAVSNLIVQDQFDKFKLDETLDIQVMGPSTMNPTLMSPNNTEVSITLRID